MASGIELVVQMKTPEDIYENVPLVEKENADFPYHYWDLTHEQRFLVDRLVELSYNNTDYTDLVEELEEIKTNFEQVVTSVKELK